ncbi:MAG: sulfatase-like hydrolase/transferase [Halobacteriaceae archaeon]
MPPNVLFVLTDQMRAHAMGCAGNPDVETPALDRLAEEGVHVTNAQTTKPMCSPARGSIVTGQFPHTHRVIYNQLRLPTDGPSMGHAFRNRGYQTGYVGKWHIDVDEDGPGRVPPGPRRQGFTDWEGFNSGHDYHRGHPRWDGDGQLYWEEGYQPAVQTDISLELIERYAAFDAPWLLFLSWGPPHPPFDAPEEYRERYDPGELELRPNVPETAEELYGRPGMEKDFDDLREDLAHYYGLITSLDDQMERLLDRLDELGEAEETVVVFTSDHGEMLGSQGRYHKGTPFEEAMNVPLLVRYPEAVPPATSDAVVSLADLLPTLCSLSGIEAPETVQGRDVAAHLRGETEGPDAAYGEDWRVGNADPSQEDYGPWGQPYRVLRTRGHSICVDYTLETQYLFDMAADPYQTENLAGDPAHADLEAELRDRLFEWAHAVDDNEFMTRQNYIG